MPTHPLPLTPAYVSDWGLAARAPRPRWPICLAAICEALSRCPTLCTALDQTLLPRHRFDGYEYNHAPALRQASFLKTANWGQSPICSFTAPRVILEKEKAAHTRWRLLCTAWWSERDLNPRHRDFHSPALPTELPDQSANASVP